MTPSGTGIAPAFQDVERMSHLAPNWDGHGASAPPRAAIDRATEVLRRIDYKFGHVVPAPTVGAVPGGVVFVWRLKKREAGREVERELEMIFFEGSAEWAIADRDAIESTRGNDDADVDGLLWAVDRYIVA
jgi:hypothetical protein